MGNSIKNRCIAGMCLVGALWLGVVGNIVYAADSGGAATASERPGETSVSILERLRSFFGDVEHLSRQGQETGAQVQQVVDQSGWKEVAWKVWNGIKAFFSDKNARDLLVDTFKLILHVIANIFTIIAGVIQKVLQSVG